MSIDTNDLKALGHKAEANRNLETFPIDFPLEQISFKTEEFICNCPITGQPDIYTLWIEYKPDERCLESKSLKLYCWTFKNKGVFAEQLAHTICQDILIATDAFWVEVTLLQNVRGGFNLETHCFLTPGDDTYDPEIGTISKKGDRS